MQLELDQIAFLGNSLTRWLIALIAALGPLLLLTLVRRLLVSRLDAISRRTANVWDDLVVALVRTPGHHPVIFSNADLLSSRIRNFKRMAERRVEFTLGVPYQTLQRELQRIPGMLRAILESVEGIRFDRAHFKGFGDNTLIFEVVYHMLDPDYDHYMDVQQRINLEICRVFDAAGIEVGRSTRVFPIRVVPPGETTTAPERPR
jgi:small-conductance mechanosensitive channel